MVIAGVNVAVSLISGVVGGVIVGLQRFDLLNSIAIGGIAITFHCHVFSRAEEVEWV